MVAAGKKERVSAGTATVGLLLNPLSGRIRKRERAVRDLLATIPGASCREITHAAGIRAGVKTFVEEDVDLLVIIGGDGTVQGVLCELFSLCPQEKLPVLALIPGGTTNMTGLDLGCQPEPEDALTQLIQCLQKQVLPSFFTERHAVRIEQNGAPAVYGMFFAVGIIAHAVIFSRGSIKKIGMTGEIYSSLIMIGYVIGLILGRRSGPWAPVRMCVAGADGTMYDSTCLFLFVSTLNRLLLGMQPYWGHEPEPLHVTFVRQQRKRFWNALWLLLHGRGDVLKEQDGYHSYNARTLELLIDDDYIIDGEFYRAASKNGPLRISSAGPLTFLVPGAGTGS